jgi:(4S)-4-hydroxy-5-phosphonooxypentane-2,3-dione isomerase
MKVTCVYVSVKPDNVGMFIEATKANHLESVKEPGNLRFDLIQQDEAYKSEADSANHKTTEHYKKWRTQVESYMAEPRKGVKYSIIEPNDPAKW